MLDTKNQKRYNKDYEIATRSGHLLKEIIFVYNLTLGQQSPVFYKQKPLLNE